MGEGNKLVIDRQKWLRGEDSTSSYLLRQADSKMCCMGFYCLTLGFTAEQITQVRVPAEMLLPDELPAGLEPLVGQCACGSAGHHESTDLTNELAKVNDAVIGVSPSVHSEEEREAKIAELFKAHLGVEIEFVN